MTVQNQHDHAHGIEFHGDMEQMGGRLARFMLDNAEQVRLVLKGEVQ